MKKRILCALLALLAVLTLAVPALGAEEVTSGTCGEDAYWSLDGDETMIISGTGDMDPYPVYDQVYKHQIVTAILEDGITNVGDHAFFDCINLKNVSLPESVTAIGDFAFYRCYGLTEIRFPDNLETIGNYSFFDCRFLTGITIPEGTTRIGNYAFGDCKRLAVIFIPKSVKYIDFGAFGGCKHLMDVYYEGTEADWDQIEIDGYNGRFTQAKRHYIDSGAYAAIHVTVDDDYVNWTDAVPFIDENDRTMVPLRAVANALGLTVGWDQTERIASFSRGGRTLSFHIGDKEAKTETGEVIPMDTAAVIVKDRTYAPVRYLAEYFGYHVEWISATRTVALS